MIRGPRRRRGAIFRPFSHGACGTGLAYGASAMLKIERTQTDEGIFVLALAGEVRGPWVEELRRVAEGVLESGAAVRVDLGDVSFVDHRGAVLLNRLANRDVALVNCSAFVTEALKVRA